MRLYYRFCRFCCQWFCLLFFRARVYGQRNVPGKGGVLLVCNHQSFFDPVLVTMALKREGNYMARDTLFENLVFRRLITSLNAFPIRRSSADVGAVKETMRRLKDGKLVVTFPEGTRTRDGSIGRFLPGARRAESVGETLRRRLEKWQRGEETARGNVWARLARARAICLSRVSQECRS